MGSEQELGTIWEGVLFLSRPEGADAPVLAEVVEPPTAQTFVFTKSHYENNQGRVPFTIDNIDPAWLPLQETTGARGAADAFRRVRRRLVLHHGNGVPFVTVSDLGY